MPKFRKKPVVIEAVQIVPGLDLTDLYKWMGENVTFDPQPETRVLTIHTLEGNMTAQWGDWIIKGVQGEFYPFKPDIFEQTYEPVDE